MDVEEGYYKGLGKFTDNPKSDKKYISTSAAAKAASNLIHSDGVNFVHTHKA